MNESDHPSHRIEPSLQIYKVEPIGWLLRDRLNLSVSIIYLFFFLLYFGVMLWLNVSSGVPLPTGFGQLFRFSDPSQYYYPNLNSIAADIIGNPLLLILMVIFRRYIPRQFLQLETDHMLEEKDSRSPFVKLARFVLLNRRAQLLLMVGLPLARSVAGAVIDLWVLRPNSPAATYAVFLSALGNYATTAVIVQLLCIFLILSTCSLTLGLNIIHPDQCSGLAPFGNLAIATYVFLFSIALLQSIGTYGGIGPYANGSAYAQIASRQLGSLGRLPQILLVILYPITVLVVIDKLLYQPHVALENYRREYLKAINARWTVYYQTMIANLEKTAERTRASEAAQPKNNVAKQIDNFESWIKLQKYILDMHTWPIPKSTLGLMSVVLNPITPFLLPLAQEVFKLFK